MNHKSFNSMKMAMTLAGILGLACASPAIADTILIDWATTTPIVTDGDGNQWNSIGGIGDQSPSNAALVDTTGAATSVKVSVTTGGGTGSGWSDFNGAAGPDPFDETAVHDDALFSGSSGSSTTTVPITISGLSANTEYTFTTIMRRLSSGRDGKITISTGTSTDIGSGIVLLLNGNVLSFKATSDATGTIALGFAENTGGSGGAAMNGMTITGTFTASAPVAPQLTAFSYDPVTGDSEVSLKGAANTDYKLVEASDLDFTTPDQDPVPLSAASVGSVAGNTITTDGSGNATVQFNLGTTKSATFIRAQTP